MPRERTRPMALQMGRLVILPPREKVNFRSFESAEHGGYSQDSNESQEGGDDVVNGDQDEVDGQVEDGDDQLQGKTTDERSEGSSDGLW